MNTTTTDTATTERLSDRWRALACIAIGSAMVAAPTGLVHLGLLDALYAPGVAWGVAVTWAPLPVSVPSTLMANVSDEYRPSAKRFQRAGLIFHLLKVAPASTVACGAVFAAAAAAALT